MRTNYKDHSNDSGIYQIVNEQTNRVYVGSAKHFKSRYYQHIKSLENGTHHNKYLQNDFNKCGSDVFVFEVLEVVEGEQVNRLLVEQRYLDEMYDTQESCYNFMKKSNVEGRSCFSKDPEKTSKKLSHARKLQWTNKEYRERIIKVLNQYRTKKGDVLSESTKQKIREARKNQTNNKSTRQVIQFDKHMNVICKFDSVTVAIQTTGIDNVVYACQGKRKTAGGFYWKYSDEWNG